jgi:N-methylhydantoinase B
LIEDVTSVEEVESRAAKIVTTLHAGDRVIFETAGGGGYGDPRRRDPQKVRDDLSDGKISAEGATPYGRSLHKA